MTFSIQHISKADVLAEVLKVLDLNAFLNDKIETKNRRKVDDT